MKTKTLNVRLDYIDIERLEYLRRKRKTTLSRIIRDLITREFFKEVEDDK